MSAEDTKSSFPSECKLAFGSSEKKQHTNLIKWTEDLEIHGKSKYGMFATIFRTKNVPEEWTTDYTPSPRDRELARDDEFLKKKIFLAMDERSKLMADWKSVQPKLSSYLISALTEASVSAIQEKERLE